MERLRLGVLIPEFPGQTHSFFWRELRALREMGHEPSVFSTRRPPKKLESHEWTPEAIQQTHYLARIDIRTALDTAGALVSAGPLAWARVLGVLGELHARSVRDRARQLLLLISGARLAGEAKRAKLDHVHVHSCGNSALIAVFAKLLQGVPYSVTLHGPLEDYGPDQGIKWRHSRFGIVITKKLRSEIERVLGGDLPQHVGLAPMGVNLDRFQRSRPYEPWTPGEPVRLFSCGRLNPCKGHDHAIRAVKLLKIRGIEAELRIAGEDDHGGTGYRGKIEALIREEGVEDRVFLLGAISENEVRRNIEQAHLFLLASVAEPLGVALMEAMALGTPCIATRSGGVPELVDHGVDGWLVPPEDPDAIAGAICEWITEPAELRRWAAAGRRKIESRFHDRRSAEELVEGIWRTSGDASEEVAEPTTTQRAAPSHAR